MSLSRPLNPRIDQLKRDNREVDGFRVAAILAEIAIKVSLRVDVGLSGSRSLHIAEASSLLLVVSRPTYVWSEVGRACVAAHTHTS